MRNGVEMVEVAWLSRLVGRKGIYDHTGDGVDKSR